MGDAVHPPEDKILEQLGARASSSLLVLSAAITCVVAPIAEEILFRGYISTALRHWGGTLPAALLTGVLFGGVHVGSAPALDLVPLGALGFGLCLLYRYTGSLYPCFAVHALNNTIAFANLENFSVAGWALLLVCSWGAIAALVLLARRVGLIAPPSPFARVRHVGFTHRSRPPAQRSLSPARSRAQLRSARPRSRRAPNPLRRRRPPRRPLPPLPPRPPPRPRRRRPRAR